jgi:predicted CXXCH cytochrome family protein
VVIEHRIMAKVDRDTKVATYEPEDGRITEVPEFRVFRVRFRVENPDSTPVTISPLIQYHDQPSAAAAVVALPGVPVFGGAAPAPVWVTLAAGGPSEELKFYVASEASDHRVEAEEIDDTETRTHDAEDGPAAGEGLYAAAQGGPHEYSKGIHSKGENPAPSVTIGPDGWTEVEFSVRATVWSEYDATYELRLTDGGTAIEPSVTATVTMRSNPDATAAAMSPQGLYPLPAVPGVPYALVAAAAASPSAFMLKAAGAGGATGGSPHGDLSLVTDTCASCHRTHAAAGASLGTSTLPQSQLCFTCHNGLGAALVAGFAGSKPNVPATAEYYQHPSADAGIGHTNANFEEFKGVSNRHAECTDCHNPHAPTNTAKLSSIASTGLPWQVSGALSGASGVRVTNSAGSGAPMYGWLNTRPSMEEGSPAYPAPVGALAYEYELCFKCHAGYTTLPTRTVPSQQAFDKAIELNPLNPANVSFHPIEATGRNATVRMGLSLSQSSTLYPTLNLRKWTLSVGSTIRCAQCHGAPGQTPTGPNASPGIRLDTHASTNRGILRATYVDRTVNKDVEAFVVTDFSLCFMCHTPDPFGTDSKDPTGSNAATNFRLHGFHMMGIPGQGGPKTVTSIDDPTAGAGNAICAECHFRMHSTLSRYGVQNAYVGGVNFAPDVTNLAGTSFQRTTGSGTAGSPYQGSCTLRCHGEVHSSGFTY